MNTVTYLENQLANLNALLHEIVGDITEQEWVSSAAPGQNRLGFIVWHMARTQDNIVQTWIRNVPEVLHRPEWAHWEELRPYGVGTGVTLEAANEIAAQVKLGETLSYADVVHQEIVGWLQTLQENDLDQAPDTNARLAPYAEYQTEEYRKVYGGIYNQPIWNLLMRPCIGHIHRHLGELQLAKAILRAH